MHKQQQKNHENLLAISLDGNNDDTQEFISSS